MRRHAKGQALRRRSGLFATIIKSRLRDLKWSRADLAAATGMSRCRVADALLQESLSERVFLRFCSALAIDLDVRQIGRPLPPLTPYERLMAWRAIDACEAAGGAAEAGALRQLIGRKQGDIERDEFDSAMSAVQRVLVRAKVKRAGYDPDEVLGDEW